MRLEDILRKLQTPEWLSQPENDPPPKPQQPMGAPPGMPPPMPEMGGNPGGALNQGAIDDLMGQQMQMQPEQGNMGMASSPALTPSQRKLRHLGRMSALEGQNKAQTPDSIKTLMG